MRKKALPYILMAIGAAWFAFVSVDALGVRNNAIFLPLSQYLYFSAAHISRTELVAAMAKIEKGVNSACRDLWLPLFLVLLGGVLNGLSDSRSPSSRVEPNDAGDRS